MEFFLLGEEGGGGGGGGRGGEGGRQVALWEMCHSRINLFTCMFCFANGGCVIIFKRTVSFKFVLLACICTHNL